MIEIEVEADDWTFALADVEAVVERAAGAALGAVEGDVVVLLTDDAAVRDLNARFRDRDRPTNVLSFPAPESAAPHLGDIVLAYGVCAAEAETQGKTLVDHLSHLVVHGVLHLLGRDHEDDAEAEEMEAEERDVLARIGVADPYAGDFA
ncbi:rRNA maturation RNase YbeY [uncultured Brevundimonas sp.]|uniref:rRNA maturation RNase YbeY n=1 Tax=uncultured Brevundimonas sp. TaxID=213418 RepID=UPI0025D60B2B|nr:rRNA maturation RNase YbeY [uncultured Brevundimonas sp.]